MKVFSEIEKYKRDVWRDGSEGIQLSSVHFIDAI